MEHDAQVEATRLRDGDSAGIEYELFVRMTCQGCADTVRNALERKGYQVIDLNLGSEVVRVRATDSAKQVLATIEAIGKDVRLIGSGVNPFAIKVPEGIGLPEESVSSIAEFRGEMFGQGSVVGMVRVMQKTQEAAVVQADLGGLEPNTSHSVAIHTYGDIRPGNQGDIFGKEENRSKEESAGFLGSGRTDEKGVISFSDLRKDLRVWEIIGRSLVIHRDDAEWTSLASSVIARSSAIGANHKKVCTCDGTVIWNAQSN